MPAIRGRQSNGLQPLQPNDQGNAGTSGQLSASAVSDPAARAVIEELQAENQRLAQDNESLQQEQRRTESVVGQLRLIQRQGALLIEQMALLQRQTQNELEGFIGGHSTDHGFAEQSATNSQRRSPNASSRRRPYQTPVQHQSAPMQQQSPMRALQALNTFNNADLEAVAMSLQPQAQQPLQVSSTPASRARNHRSTPGEQFQQVGSSDDPIARSVPDLPEANTRYYISGVFAALNKTWRQNVWPWEYSGRRALKDGLVREYRICLGSNVCPRPGCGTHLRPKQRNTEPQACTNCGDICVHVECPATFVVNTPAGQQYHVAQFEGEHTHPPHRPIHHAGH